MVKGLHHDGLSCGSTLGWKLGSWTLEAWLEAGRWSLMEGLLEYYISRRVADTSCLSAVAVGYYALSDCCCRLLRSVRLLL